jgi:hypothetical protein
LTSSNDQKITIELAYGKKTAELTVVNHPDHTVDELVERWTRRANNEYRRDLVGFERTFVSRINRRHEFLLENSDQVV